VKVCGLIPHYNSKGAVRGVLERLAPLGLSVIVVDDGSCAEDLDLVRSACSQYGAELLAMPKNGGKGAAVKAGLVAAQERGFTHALQMDADGQHRVEDVPAFLEAARREPSALVLCTPQYGEDVPMGRLVGRQISRIWAWIETLSLAIQDPLVGFRVYPLGPSVRLVHSGVLGDRMEFDLQIAVRLRWLGVSVINVPSRIDYPEGGISHFHMLSDNFKLSGAHTRLVLGMIVRFPWILRGRSVL
jgi:glycosyltransferase involved in cell wall biosynthesis